jgi:hypothetical protein
LHVYVGGWEQYSEKQWYANKKNQSFLFPTIRSDIIANEVRNDLGTKHHRELSWLNNLLLKHVPMVDRHIQKILQQEQQSHALVGRRVGPRTCCRCGKAGRASLKLAKQPAKTPQKNTATKQIDGKENPPSPDQGRAFLSLSLFGAKGI